MAGIGSGSGSSAPRKRADARRNEKALLDAAAAAFIASGVDVPVRDIAAKAGVGVGTIYRHFPTRADLIVAVAAGPSPQGGAGLYARVSCHDQKAGPDRQVARLPAWAAQAGLSGPGPRPGPG